MNPLAPETGPSTEDAEFVDCIRRSHASERRAFLLQFLREQIASSLAIDPAQIAGRDNLLELGVDSLKAVELKFLLESKLSLQLSSSLIFDYPTLDALVGFLLEQISPSQEQPLQPSAAPQPAVDLSDEELNRLLANEIKELNLSPAD